MKNFLFTLSLVLSVGFSKEVNSQIEILNENFDSGIPSNFILHNNDGYTPHASVSEYVNAWISKVDPLDSTNVVASSTSYFDQPGLADRWLVTPSLSLGAFGNVLSWSARSHDASYAENYLVLASISDASITSFTDTLAVVVNEGVSWKNYEVNLSEKGFDNQVVHVAFVLRSIDGFKFYLDSLNVRKEDPLSVKELSSFDVKIYPNPVTDVLSFDTNTPIDLAIIRDVNGAIVKQTTEQKINVQNLTNGVYFLELIYPTGNVTKKFIKR